MLRAQTVLPWGAEISRDASSRTIARVVLPSAPSPSEGRRTGTKTEISG